MTKEQIYREQLEALGIYDPAFEPEIKTLAQMERQLTRVQKEWKETAPEGGKPSFLDPCYAVITRLQQDILKHRDALGLTPQGLRRISAAYYETKRIGASAEKAKADEEASNVLEFVRKKFGG